MTFKISQGDKALACKFQGKNSKNRHLGHYITWIWPLKFITLWTSIPGIVTKDILQVLVACSLQIAVDVAFVDENSAPKDLQNSRLNMMINEPLADCRPSPPRWTLTRETGEEFIWLLSSNKEEKNMADSNQENSVSIFIAIF